MPASLPPIDPSKAVSSVVAAIGAIGALGLAAAGLVDGTKVFGGGLSLAGLRIINRTLKDYAEVLASSGVNWHLAVRANWINGKSKADQKAFVLELVRLGLSPDSVRALKARLGHALKPRVEDESDTAVPINFDLLIEAVTKVHDGKTLEDKDVAVLGRFDDIVAARLDVALEAADQLYRNTCKLVSSGVAIALSIWAGALLAGAGWSDWLSYSGVGMAVLVGVLAVPLAPISKDLASTLQAAAKALKPAK